MSYDGLGRVPSSTQTTQSNAYTFPAYSYNLVDGLTSMTLPSGRVVDTARDTANRETDVRTRGSQTAYVSRTGYWPHGAVGGYWLGNNVARSVIYNSRLQTGVYWDAVNDSPDSFVWHVGPLDWGSTNNNGNLLGQTIHAGGPGSFESLTAFNQGFAYDGANRLRFSNESSTACNGTCWYRNYSYDERGNMWIRPEDYGGVGLNASTPTSNVYDANNHNTVTAAYDAAGNQTTVPFVCGGCLHYDAENRLDRSTGSGPVTYGYDGDGKRVTKSAGGQTTIYVYDAFGQLAAEYSSGAAGTPACNTCYLSTDHLGSVRLVTGESAQVVSRHDFLPFGEEIPGNAVGRDGHWGANDSVSQRFTGKERDAETQLDYFGARYFEGALGRWTSPDEPLADQDERDPQSWNLYSYVRNNPLANVDPSGLDCIVINNQTLSTVDITTEEGSSPSTCKGAYVEGTVDRKSYQFNGTNLTYSFAKNTASGVGRIEFSKYFGGDSLSPDVASELANAGNRAAPIVNAAGAGLVLFGSLVEPLPMALAQCGAGNCDKANLAMAVLPEVTALRAGATPAKAGRGLHAAGILEKTGGFAQATRDFETLQGTEKTIGGVKVRELSDGTKAVLRNSSRDGRPTLEIQHPSGEVTKYRYN